jgi:hypothetical protein
VYTTRSTHLTAVVAFACLALLVLAGPAAARPADVQVSGAPAQSQPQDLRSPDTADATTQPSAPTTPAPAVHVASDSGGGIGWLTIALGLAGSLLALGGIVAIAVHARRLGRVHISA